MNWFQNDANTKQSSCLDDKSSSISFQEIRHLLFWTWHILRTYFSVHQITTNGIFQIHFAPYLSLVFSGEAWAAAQTQIRNFMSVFAQGLHCLLLIIQQFLETSTSSKGGSFKL